MGQSRCHIWVVIVVIVSVVASLAEASGAGTEHHYYQPQVVFSMPYGTEPEEVGLDFNVEMGQGVSVRQIVVPTEDIIFAVDDVQGRIKRFDATDGSAVVAADHATRVIDTQRREEIQVPLHNVGSIAADQTGRLYVSLGGMLNKVEVYSPDGRIVRSPTDEAGNKVGVDGWDKIRQGIVSALTYTDVFPHISGVQTDEMGYVYVLVSPAPTPYNALLIKFSSDLDLVGSVPGWKAGWDGRTYGFAGNRGESRYKLVVFSPGKTTEASVMLRPPAEVSEGDYDSVRGWQPMDTIRDGQGCTYVVLSKPRPEHLWRAISADIAVTRDTVMYKFDSSGKFLTKLVLDGVPQSMSPPLAVGPSGNIYHMVYHEDRVDFVKEELAVQAADMLTSPVRVGLRQAMESEGWTVAWNAKERTVSARRGQTLVELTVGKGYAKVNGHVVPIAHPARLAAGRVQAPDALVQQILYREQGPARYAYLAKPEK